MYVMIPNVNVFDPIKMEPMLSPLMGTVLKGKPHSSNRDFIHMICQHVSDNAIYSASVDEKATVFCNQDCQHTMPLAKSTTYPVVDWRMARSAAQSESVKAIRLVHQLVVLGTSEISEDMHHFVKMFLAGICCELAHFNDHKWDEHVNNRNKQMKLTLVISREYGAAGLCT